MTELFRALAIYASLALVTIAVALLAAAIVTVEPWRSAIAFAIGLAGTGASAATTLHMVRPTT